MKPMTSILLFTLVQITFSQTPTNDFFPLSVGNSWTYKYSTSSTEFLGDMSYADTGTAVYSIISQLVTTDSTIWGVTETRDIVHFVGHYFPPQYTTTTAIKDTTVFSIIEYHSENHRFVRIGNRNLFSVFPFTQEFQDSISFFRYYPSQTLDTFTVATQSTEAPYHRFHISFQRFVGITKVSYSLYQIIDADASTNHTLRSSIITSVNDSPGDITPNSVVLFQNYPNPFNPATVIPFSNSENAKLTIRIYDILGRLVETIFDNQIQAGNHLLVWDASKHASGIYLCRMETKGIEKSIRLVLLK